MSIEVMKQALEALETLDAGNTYKTHNAASALRQAIAEAEKQETPPECQTEAEKQEPVAWMRTSGTGSPVVTEELLIEMPEMRWNFQQPLYTHPQPKREWVGLTDEEFDAMFDNLVMLSPYAVARVIEAKLKEKNT